MSTCSSLRCFKPTCTVSLYPAVLWNLTLWEPLQSCAWSLLVMMCVTMQACYRKLLLDGSALTIVDSTYNSICDSICDSICASSCHDLVAFRPSANTRRHWQPNNSLVWTTKSCNRSIHRRPCKSDLMPCSKSLSAKLVSSVSVNCEPAF